MKKLSKMLVASALVLSPFIYSSAQEPSKDVKKDSLEFKLTNYPNPFMLNTTISYRLPVASDVSLDIYDMAGRKLSTPVHQKQPAGEYLINFDGSNFARGTYIYRLSAGKEIVTGKMVLTKGFRYP